MHLTYRDPLAHTGMVSAPPAEAGAPEVEITNEMLEAGAAEIDGFDLQDAWDSPSARDDLISRVYRAMHLALRKTPRAFRA